MAALLEGVLGGGIVAPFLAVRVPVRSTESWLMADRDACAAFFATSLLPERPDQLENAKLALVDACRASGRREIRDGVVPRPGSGRSVGPEYEALLIEFGAGHWDPMRARIRSPSLERTWVRLTERVTAGLW